MSLATETPGMSPTELRDYYRRRHASLKADRQTWDTHWRELASYTMPRLGRWFDTDPVTRGGKRHDLIIDSAATKALRTMAAGMMAGATSPARPWFRLTTPEPDLNRRYLVRRWLDVATEKTQRVFRKSNTYRALHSIYEETGLFGTACSIMAPNFDTVLHHHILTVGEYALQQDFNGKVVTCYREFDMPVGALVAEFDYDNVSSHVKNLYNARRYDAMVHVVHAIEPRPLRDAQRRDNLNMPWASVYFEDKTDAQSILRESGFRKFPVLAPRWGTAGSDVYGYSPGMDSLGDTKALQHQQKRKAQAIDFQVIPPTQHPAHMKGREINKQPGGSTPVEGVGPSNGIRTLWDVNLDLSALREDMQELRNRIRENYFADLFLMLAQSDLRNMTATEVAQRHEEKLTMLGPVYERLQNELYEPLIDFAFTELLEAGAFPPPPPELEGLELQVEFISVMAQAQKAVGAVSADRFIGTIGALANLKKEALDLLNEDEAVAIYADMLAIDPRLVRSPDEVAQLREARNRAQAAQAQAELMKTQGEAARGFAALPQTPAQTDVLGMFTGYNNPSPQAI